MRSVICATLQLDNGQLGVREKNRTTGRRNIGLGLGSVFDDLEKAVILCRLLPSRRVAQMNGDQSGAPDNPMSWEEQSPHVFRIGWFGQNFGGGVAAFYVSQNLFASEVHR